MTGPHPTIVWHGGRLLALEERHAPFEVDPNTLESKGSWRFDGRLEGPMTAHPKMNPVTGEMLFFGFHGNWKYNQERSGGPTVSLRIAQGPPV